jgi:hypothetical protein
VSGVVAIPKDEGVGWLDGHLRDSAAPLLDVPWILDIDTTIKPLYVQGGHHRLLTPEWAILLLPRAIRKQNRVGTLRIGAIDR